MSQKSIRSPRHPLKGKGNAFHYSSCQQVFFHLTESIEARELGFKISGPIHSLLRHRRVQLKGPPGDLWLHRTFQFTQGPFEPTFSDVAPWTDDIGIDFYCEGASGHAKCPILPA